MVEGYRDERGKSCQRIIKCYGELSELEQAEANILERLRAEAAGISEKKHTQILLDMNLSNCYANKHLNYGYFFIESIFDELNIPEFVEKFVAGKGFRYDLCEILRLLTYGRILEPASKLETVEKQDRYFQPFNEKIDNVYRSLEVFDEIKEDLQAFLHKQITEKYDRDCSLVFYDVTNYYFETETQSELKKPGVSKENKKNPITQMGLFIDTKGIPISYKLFSGNTNDCKTLQPV